MVSIGDEGCTWFARLIEHEWFRKAVLDRMNELDDDFLQTLNDVEAKAAELRTSADKNAEKNKRHRCRGAAMPLFTWKPSARSKYSGRFAFPGQ